MFKTKCFFIVLIVLPFTITGQDFKAKVDSLTSLLPQQRGIHRINTLNELAWEFTRKNDSIAILYALLATQSSDSLQYAAGLATSYIRLGTLYLNNNQFKEAEAYIHQALSIEKKEKNKAGVARAKTQLGKLYKKIGDYDKAIKTYEESLSIKIELKDKAKIALSYNNLARVYEAKKEFKKALEYYYKSIEIRESENDQKKLITAYKNLGHFYNNALRRPQSALRELRKGWKICVKLRDSIQLSYISLNIGDSYYKLSKKDSALFYYTKSLFLSKKSGIKDRTVLYSNIASIYHDRGALEKALNYYKKSIENAIENKEITKQLLPYYNIGNTYLKLKQYKKALEYLYKAEKLSYVTKNEEIRVKIFMSLAETYEKLKNYKKASEYNESSSVLQQQIKQQIERENEKIKILEYEKNQRQIIEAKNATNKAQLARKSILVYALIIGCFLLSILFFALFRSYRLKKQTTIAQQNEKIKQAEIEKLLKKQELKSIHAMIDGQEKERKRIAQDLHDRLGSMLSVVKIHYQSIEENLDKIKAESKIQYHKANQLLDEACIAVREISHNMVSGVLTKFGLVPALQELIDNIESSNKLTIELIVYGFDNRLDNTIEIQIYRIVQELLNNILKHAKATDVSIQLLKREEGINITVVDDGIGFEANDIKNYTGIGLKGIFSRIENLDGELEIDSGKGNGTTVTIEIPLTEQINNL